MKETDFFDGLLTKLFPYMKRNYELDMMKKQLNHLDRYRQRLSERIKKLEIEIKSDERKKW